MELKLSGGGKIDFEAREFKSHLYGIEINFYLHVYVRFTV